nr:MAG TPA: hypothetical protein [Microviridae sp.]
MKRFGRTGPQYLLDVLGPSDTKSKSTPRRAIG